MASHTVKFTLPERILGKADVIFEVKKDKEKFGELRVSNGSAVWFPKNSQRGKKISWSKLNDLFDKHGNDAEKR